MKSGITAFRTLTVS